MFCRRTLTKVEERPTQKHKDSNKSVSPLLHGNREKKTKSPAPLSWICKKSLKIWQRLQQCWSASDLSLSSSESPIQFQEDSKEGVLPLINGKMDDKITWICHDRDYSNADLKKTFQQAKAKKTPSPKK